MDSSAALVSGDEWPPQTPLFGKLGDYFDRPGWWGEGAETLKAFFNENTPQEDTTDQRLEDLLDLLESLRVCEEPSRPNNAGVDLSDLSACQQEPKHDLRHHEDHAIEPSSNDVQLQAEPVSLSDNSFPTANPVHAESVENGVAPAITNDTQNPRSPPEDSVFVKQFPILDTNALGDAINTSSPLFTGTTTSTRQTSPRLDSSTRASSIFADVAVSFNSSVEDEIATPSLSEASKLGSFVSDATVNHQADLPPEITKENNDNAVTDSTASAEEGITSILLDHMHDRASNEQSATTKEITTVSENDPTGLQAIKDEISDEYELPKDVDSSMLAQEDDVSVVHDPSAAATSFFPPNPYSDDPYDSSVYTAQIQPTASNENYEHIDDMSADSTLTSLASGDGQTSLNTVQLQSTVHKEELNDLNHENIDNSSADSTLTSLASGDGQLPGSQPVNQVNVRERYTPSPPPISPLTPPPNLADATYTNADVVDMAGSEDRGKNAPSAILSTVDQDVTILSDAAIKQAGVDPLQGPRALDTVDEVVDKLADDNCVDGTKTSSDSLTLVNAKRKQEQPHADEPAQKKRFLPTTEDGHQQETNTETVPASEKKTGKGKSKKAAQKGKNKATLRPAQRDSPDELGPTSPDELADSFPSNPFNLNRGSQELGKTNLPPLRKLIGIQRATRGGVVRKELAGLLAASPPRTAAEKEKSDVGGRLRSGSRTPAPASAAGIVPDAQTAIAAETDETDETNTPAQPKRNRLPGAHPLSALELRELGDAPILESRTRTRTTTVEPAPDPATQDLAKPAPKRTKAAISNAEVERLGTVEITESRTRSSTAEPTPVPTPVPTSAKRAKKPVVRAAEQNGAKPSPFALALKSKGTPSASRKRAPPKKKAVASGQKKETAVAKQTKVTAKRKRENDDDKVGRGATRASKRVAGEEPGGQ
ncbi:hypothetical protein KCU95_g14060, partial [Aureobasidium melanogenum]